MSGEKVDLSKQEPSQRFDFLLGEWSYRFEQGHGKTMYERVSHGAIRENLGPGFNNGAEFSGSALYLYKEGVWNQHWIDTFGNVLKGTGKMESYSESDLPALVLNFKSGGVYMRHVWYNITPNRFDTDLLVSQDGVTFRLMRRMPYIRK